MDHLMKEFISKGYSKELSEYLIKHYPKTGFGSGWLDDKEIEENYKIWIEESIKSFNIQNNKLIQKIT